MRTRMKMGNRMRTTMRIETNIVILFLKMRPRINH